MTEAEFRDALTGIDYFEVSRDAHGHWMAKVVLLAMTGRVTCYEGEREPTAYLVTLSGLDMPGRTPLLAVHSMVAELKRRILIWEAKA